MLSVAHAALNHEFTRCTDNAYIFHPPDSNRARGRLYHNDLIGVEGQRDVLSHVKETVV